MFTSCSNVVQSTNAAYDYSSSNMKNAQQVQGHIKYRHICTGFGPWGILLSLKLPVQDTFTRYFYKILQPLEFTELQNN